MQKNAELVRHFDVNRGQFSETQPHPLAWMRYGLK